MDINKFSRLKDEILNHDKRYEIFNILINDANLINQDINSALISILARLRKGNLKTCYKLNITNDEYKTLVNNFEKIEIKILTFEDLEKYPISSEYIHSLLSNVAYNKYPIINYFYVQLNEINEFINSTLITIIITVIITVIITIFFMTQIFGYT